MSDPSEIPQNVLDNLLTVFADGEYGNLAAILARLCAQDAQRHIQALGTALKDGVKTFNKTVRNMVDDIERWKDEYTYCKVMASVEEDYLKPSRGNENPNQGVNWTMVLRDSSLQQNVIALSVVRTLAKMPPPIAKLLIQQAVEVRKKADLTVASTPATAAGSILARMRGTTGTVAVVGLASVYLGWEALQAMRQWWSGEISGKRCVQIIVDTASSCAAGVGGGILGAAVGGFILPGLGSIVGAIVGGGAAATVAQILTDWLTQQLFDLPKTVASENAYRFLGIPQHSTNNEINCAFRALALRYHPDKGGDGTEFEKLQCAMGVIKLAKGVL